MRPDRKRGSIVRCGWVGNDPLMQSYHDEEWGRPVHDDDALFELLTLEGAQAGLSWKTILHKRENYRRAFSDFSIEEVAQYGRAEVRRLLADAGIVRNRLKIESTVANARAIIALRRDYGSLDAFVWGLSGGGVRVNRWTSIREIPAKTAVSDRMSKGLKSKGLRFVGSTICYAFMQAAGMVNDHTLDCSFRRSAKPLRIRRLL